MSDGKKVRRYPFESFAWDDDTSNNNRWCDAAEVEAAFDKAVAELQAEVAQAKREAADAMSGCCDCPMFRAQGKTVARQARVIEKLKAMLNRFTPFDDLKTVNQELEAIKQGEET